MFPQLHFSYQIRPLKNSRQGLKIGLSKKGLKQKEESGIAYMTVLQLFQKRTLHSSYKAAPSCLIVKDSGLKDLLQRPKKIKNVLLEVFSYQKRPLDKKTPSAKVVFL